MCVSVQKQRDQLHVHVQVNSHIPLLALSAPYVSFLKAKHINAMNATQQSVCMAMLSYLQKTLFLQPKNINQLSNMQGTQHHGQTHYHLRERCIKEKNPDFNPLTYLMLTSTYRAPFLPEHDKLEKEEFGINGVLSVGQAGSKVTAWFLISCHISITGFWRHYFQILTFCFIILLVK